MEINEPQRLELSGCFFLGTPKLKLKTRFVIGKKHVRLPLPLDILC